MRTSIPNSGPLSNKGRSQLDYKAGIVQSVDLDSTLSSPSPSTSNSSTKVPEVDSLTIQGGKDAKMSSPRLPIETWTRKKRRHITNTLVKSHNEQKPAVGSTTISNSKFSGTKQQPIKFSGPQKHTTSSTAVVGTGRQKETLTVSRNNPNPWTDPRVSFNGSRQNSLLGNPPKIRHRQPPNSVYPSTSDSMDCFTQFFTQVQDIASQMMLILTKRQPKKPPPVIRYHKPYQKAWPLVTAV